jgi:hypothetical protein
MKPIISCATNLISNLEVLTNTTFVKKSRENILEFLLINHPLDCPICDQAGECDLQDQSLIYGSDRSRFKEIKRSVNEKKFGPIIKTIMTRCIHCTRCIRFSDEIMSNYTIGTIGRGNETEIKMLVDSFFDNELSGNLVDICPVGALTSKPYAFTGRPWELKNIESIDVLDSMHSNIRINVKGNRILRILPIKNDNINENWITDITRFSYESLNYFRIKFPFIFISNFIFFDFFNLYNNNIIFNFKSRMSWNNVFFFLRLNSNVLMKNISFFIGNELGIFNSFFFYFFLKHFKNTSFFIENDILTDIDNRSSYYIDRLIKNDLLIINHLNIKKSIPLLGVKIKKKFNNNNILYVGPNIEHHYFVYHLGFTLKTLYNLLKHKFFLNNKIIKKISNDITIYTNNNYNTLYDILNNLKYINKIIGGNCIEHSNLIGLYEFGIKSFNNNLNDFNKNKLNYYLKTKQFKNNNKKLSIYQGSFFFDTFFDNYIYLPSLNMFEFDDFYINLFSIRQFSYKSIDSSEKEEIKSDFYIIKSLFFLLFHTNSKSHSVNNLISLDFIFNKLIFYFFNYFSFVFDLFPLINFYKNHKNEYLFKKYLTFNKSINKNFFLLLNNPYIKYSNTLNSIYININSKNNNNFFNSFNFEK